MGRINDRIEHYDDPLTAEATFSSRSVAEFPTENISREALRELHPVAFSIPQEMSIYDRPGNSMERSIRASVLEAVNDPLTRVVAVFEIHEDARYEEINSLVSTGKFTHVVFESPSNDQALVDNYLATGEVPYTRRMNAVAMDRVSLEHIRAFNQSTGADIKAIAAEVPYDVQEIWEKELKQQGHRIEDIIKLVAERRDREVVGPAILEIVNEAPEAKVLVLRGRGHAPVLMEILSEGLRVPASAPGEVDSSPL
jgi:hypothetical protein